MGALPEQIQGASIAAAAAIVGALTTAYVDYQLRSRGMDNKMVELAIDVLKADCKTEPGLVPARKWAVEVINHYATVKLEPDAQAALAQHSIGQGSFSSDFSPKDFDVARNPCT